MSLANQRRLRDASLSRSKAFPRNDGVPTFVDSMDAYTDDPIFLGIDIQEPGPFRPDGFILELAVDAAPSLADGQSITWTLQHSADGQSFSDTIPLVRASVVGADGQGTQSVTIFLAEPIPLLRYITLEQVCEGEGDPSTDGRVVFSVLC